jgi:DUF1680 family protein
MYTTSDDGVQVHLYEKSTSKLNFKNSVVEIEQETDYPWSGEVTFTVETDIEEPFSISLRIPSWADDFVLRVDGKAVIAKPQNGYVKLSQSWKGKHTVELSLPMKVEFIEAHPFVRDNLEKVAVKRGPVVYCIEQADNPDFHVWTLVLNSESLKEEKGKILDREAVFLKGTGRALDISEWEGKLYRKLSEVREKDSRVHSRSLSHVGQQRTGCNGGVVEKIKKSPTKGLFYLFWKSSFTSSAVNGRS